MLRLRLDEGGGEVLKNSAPNANPQTVSTGKFKPQWGETTWLWPDFRMDTSTRVMLGQTGDFEGNQAFFNRWLVHVALRTQLHFDRSVGRADVEDGCDPA